MSNSKNRFGFLIALLVSSSFSLTSRADSSSPLGFLPPVLRQQLAIPSETVPSQSAPPDGSGQSASQTTNVISLVDYLRAHVTHETIDDLEKDNSGYNRRDDFGGWIVADSKTSCLDTRGQVLVRAEDPSTPITYKDARNCNVVKGLWHDPYAGQDYKLAKAIQIDHVVPLKHVYVTGGKAWAPEKRCYYANFLHNDFHLLAVSGHENMSKSDKGPDQYLPPDETFQCQYISTWMKVKAIWQLVSTDAELATIEKVIQDHHCSEAKLEYGEADLEAERRAIEDSVPERCQNFAVSGPPSFTDLANQQAHQEAHQQDQAPAAVPAVPSPAY